MEKEEEKENLKFAVHPLVLLNVCDHITRAKLQQQNKDGLVYGILLGKKINHEVHMCSSFELKINNDNELLLSISPDWELLSLRLAQYKVILPDLELKGFYITVAGDNSSNLSVSPDVQKFCDAILHMPLKISENGLQLPQLVVAIIDYLELGERRKYSTVPIRFCNFVENKDNIIDITTKEKSFKTSISIYDGPVRVAADNAEYVALRTIVDDDDDDDEKTDGKTGSLFVNRCTSTSEAVSAALRKQIEAHEAFAERVCQLAAWLEAVIAENVTLDHELVRGIAAVVANRPSGNSVPLEHIFSDIGVENGFAEEYLGLLTANLGQVSRVAAQTPWASLS